MFCAFRDGPVLLIIVFVGLSILALARTDRPLSHSALPVGSSLLSLIVDLLLTAVALVERVLFGPPSQLRSENFFAMLYLLLNSDGHIAPEEACILDETMDRLLYLSSHSRRISIMQSMRRARASGRTFSSFAQAFAREAGSNKRALSTAFDCLVTAAGCDGTIDASQMRMLNEACRVFGLPANRLQDTIATFHDVAEEEAEWQTYKSFHQTSEHQHNSASEAEERSGLGWAYKQLGCAPGDASRLIKKRYRDAIRTLHPDSFIANGVDPLEAKKRAQLFLEVQKAYEELSKAGVV
jgi:DnaJ-domain-containing protein 1